MNFQTQRVLYSSTDIKREAKAQLEGHWKEAVLLAIVPTVFSFLFFQGVSETDLYGVFLELIQEFLVTGVTFGFMNLLRNQSYLLDPFQEIASPFRANYFKNLLSLKLWKYLYIFLWTLLFVVPGIVKAYSYSQAELIYKDSVDRTGEQPDARECLKESQELMKGYKGELFALDLSFIGCKILNAFTFGILGLWLTPYTTMSRVVFYENITEGFYLGQKNDRSRHDINNVGAFETDEEIGKDPDDFRDFEDF